MAYTRRRFNSHIKSLVHFDYPYFNEPYDGCRDEINGNIFTRSGDAKFVGNEIPCDEIISGTPKFGYRCLSTSGNNDYISGKITCTLSSYEIECFIRITGSSQGNIFRTECQTQNGITLSKNIENKIVFTHNDPDNSSELITSGALRINTWEHIKCQVSGHDVSIYLNGEETGSKNFPGLMPQDLSRIYIGGITGQTDEFILRDALTENHVPSEPYQGTCSIEQYGGFGTGTSDVKINADAVINSYALIEKAAGKNLTLTGKTQSSYSEFTSGTEILIHVSGKKESDENSLGLYAFRRITGISGNVITLDREITDEFDLISCVNKYYVQAISVPNFKSLTLNAGIKITPLKWGSGRGGIIVFRTSENCSVEGSILTSGYGVYRSDKIQMTHADLSERLILSQGGGIMIFCGGLFTSGNTSRLGASWDGALTGGIAYTCKGEEAKPGGNGGAGYGGAGCIAGTGAGGSGGVGGGGGGADTDYGGDAGSIGRRSVSDIGFQTGEPGTGGAAGQWMWSDGNSSMRNGGTAGVMLNTPDSTLSTGGAGAGGKAGNSSDDRGKGGIPGSNVIIIAKKLKADMSSISTGGQGGYGDYYGSGAGGGGTGFAYIACEEMI